MSADWLFGIQVENTVRITCVFNANLKRTNRQAVVYGGKRYGPRSDFSSMSSLMKFNYVTEASKTFQQTTKQTNFVVIGTLKVNPISIIKRATISQLAKRD